MALRIDRAPANVELQVATNSPAEGPQGLRKRRNARLPFQIVFGEIHQYADPAHPHVLLSARRERPSCSAADKTEKFPPPHVRP